MIYWEQLFMIFKFLLTYAIGIIGFFLVLSGIMWCLIRIHKFFEKL